jgi:hypothetical protein
MHKRGGDGSDSLPRGPAGPRDSSCISRGLLIKLQGTWTSPQEGPHQVLSTAIYPVCACGMLYAAYVTYQFLYLSTEFDGL